MFKDRVPILQQHIRERYPTSLLPYSICSIHLPEQTMAGVSSLVLRKHLERLPQELYDIIHDMTFTTARGAAQVELDPCGRRPISSPPPALNLMQVSSATRRHFCLSYYNNIIFNVRDIVVCSEWIKSMPKSHRKLLKHVRCFELVPLSPAPLPWHTRVLRIQESRFLLDLIEQCRLQGMAALHIEIRSVVSCQWETVVTLETHLETGSTDNNNQVVTSDEAPE
jgi:hypothetical protein